MKHIELLIYVIFFYFSCYHSIAIGIPSKNSNIEYLVVYGNMANQDKGDDDFSQVIFFMVPENYMGDVYFRIFDPETSGDYDKKTDFFDTATRFTIYSGKGTHTSLGSRLPNPNSEYQKGTMITTKTFGGGEYNNEWYTFNPIKNTEGEWLSGYYVFRLVVEGISGNDANFYKVFLSSSGTVNTTVPNSNAFCYEMTFCLFVKDLKPLFLNPYIPNQNVTLLNQYNFDMEGQGSIRGYFSNNFSEKMALSGDKQWATSTHILQPSDIYSFVKVEINPSMVSADNIVTFYFTDDQNLPVPIYTEPMGK